MDDVSSVYQRLKCFGVDQAPAWADPTNINQLCVRCQAIDWDTTLLYLSIADEYEFYPRVQLYSSHPELHQIRDTAHIGCHLCTLVLTCLLSMRYRYSVEVDPLPDGLEEICDTTIVEVNVEAMARSPPVYLTVSISNHGKLFGWHDMSLPIVSELPPPDVLSNRLPASEIAKRWLDQCLQTHQSCSAKIVRLPRRIVNITKDTLRLEEPASKAAPYATLSYAIGGAHLFTTTSNNLKDRKAGFALASLPKTAQDAVWWTRKLGLQYLWLDSLCILQDNLSDWEIELSSMADIYQHSTVTIAATRAENAQVGCMPNSNKLNLITCQPRQGVLVIADYGRGKWIFQKGVLDTRSWCFQELQLSTRVLRVGGECIAWQCRKCKRLEDSPSLERVHDIQDNVTFFGSRPLDAKFASGDRPFKLWYALVQNFGRRNLSFAADKLPAFSGMAQRFQDILKARYLAGLWEEDLMRGLVWRMSKPGRHVTYRSPSWSWASVDGGFLGWNVWLYNATDFEAEVLDVRVHVEGLNPYGRVSSGKLTMYGATAPVPSSLLGDESEVGPVNWRQHLLHWDRAETPGLGSVLFRHHRRMCIVLQPIKGTGLWTRTGSLVTAMEGEPAEYIELTEGALNSFDWSSTVVSIV